MSGISRVILFCSANNSSFCQNIRNSSSQRNFSNDSITPFIMFLALPRVPVFDCNVVLSMLIIPRTSFNKITPIKNVHFCNSLRIPEIKSIVKY